ncbi:MAG: AMP-binding protein, partial [Ilumatobacter fluminis]
TRPDFVPAARFGRCEPSPDGFLHRRAALTVDELQSGAGGAPAVAAVAAAMVAVSPFFPGETEVSLVASTRDHPTAEPLVGYFLNQMPVTAQVDPEQSASEVASIAGRLIGEALPSRSYPFARIAADRIRSGRSAPAGSVLVSYIDFVPTTFQGRPIEQSTLWNGAAVADAAFFVEPDETAVRLGLEYSGDAIDEAVARSLLEAFDRALTAIVRRHAVEVATLTAELAPAAGDASVLDGDPLTDDRLVTERIWDHLADRADRSLIDAADGQLTWGQAAARAGQIAAALRSAGVEPGQRVAVRLPRSKYLPAAIVALHAVGAVYVPIDPTYPRRPVAPEREAGRGRGGAVTGIAPASHRRALEYRRQRCVRHHLGRRARCSGPARHGRRRRGVRDLHIRLDRRARRRGRVPPAARSEHQRT